MASPIHPFEIIGYIILAIMIILFTACAVVLILHFVSVCYAREEKATQQAQAPADDTEEARKEARKTAIKKAADDRLAELQHRRALEAARADGWNEAHIAMEQDLQRLEAEGTAGSKAVQEPAATPARDEAEGAADRKTADDRLAELQHRRDVEEARADGWNQAYIAMEQERERLEADAAATNKEALEAARADGWNQAHIAMEPERQRLEADAAAGRKAVQELAVTPADKEAEQEQQRLDGLEATVRKGTRDLAAASARYKAESAVIRKALQEQRRLKAEGKSDRKALQELQRLKTEREKARSAACSKALQKHHGAFMRGKPWDEKAEQQLNDLRFPDTDSEGEE